MRANDGFGLAQLCSILQSADVQMRQQALLILGNLCSDSVDAQSLLTKRTLLQPERSAAILSCLDEEQQGAGGAHRATDPASEMTILFSCGCLQNLCHDQLWSELLVQCGRSPANAAAMLVPEAFENHKEMDPRVRAFFEYQRTLMEPWDGPAALCFTDGFTFAILHQK